MIPARRRGEEGSTLIVALVFVTVFAILIAAVISFTEVGLRASKSYASHAKSTYAADGAAHAAVNRYGRGGPCDNYAAPLDPEGEAVNGRDLIVHCDGPPPGASRATKPVNALLGLGPEGITSTGEVRVLGNIFSNSTVTAGATMVVQGEVGALGACTGPIQTSPPAPLKCANTGGGADPVQGRDPDYTKATATVPVHRIVPGCPAAPGWLVELEPGYYDDAAALTALTGGSCPGAVVWFKPGNYYLDFTFRGGAATWTVNDPSVDVVAGEPKGWDPDPLDARPALAIPGSCLTEADPGPVDGVQLIAGGGTHIQIDRGRVELCAEPSTADQSIALYGIKPDLPTHNLEPTSVQAATGFTEAGRALIIGESPVATSDASLTSGGTTEAEVTLTAFVPSVPAGSLIDAVELRVAHRDDGDIEQPAVDVSFPGPTGGGCSPPPLPVSAGAVMEHRIDLKAAPCALDDASDFEKLEVTYKVALTSSGTSAVAHLDGLAVEVTYRAPTTRKPTVVTAVADFTSPDNALEIGEQPTPLTADADLDAAGPLSASITLGGLGNPPIPAGSTIDSAVLRVAHKDEGDIDPPTVTVLFATSTCTDLPLPINATAILDDRVDLKACGLDDPAELLGLTATYDVALSGGGTAATASLDGMFLELVYRPPAVARPPTTVSDVTVFTTPDNAKAIGEQPTPLTADAVLDAATTTASLTVSGGFDQPVVPAGSFIASATLRIAHRDDGDMSSVTVTPSFTGNTCGAQTLTRRQGAIGVDTVDLRTCGLTDAAQLTNLSATFTVTLAVAGVSATEALDGVVLDLAHRPVATYQPASTSAVTGFADPDNARAIGEQPTVLTADAVFGAGTTPATLTVNGFNQVPVPSGSAIDSAVMRVAHRDEGMASVGLTAAFDDKDAGECENVPLALHPAAIEQDSVDLKACGFTSAAQLASLAATYTATPLTTPASATRVPDTAVSGDFTPSDAARAIDGVPAGTDLGLANTSDTITLSGYDQPALPAGSVIQTAVLRVAHQDDGQMGDLTVTVSTGATCTSQVLAPNPGAIDVDVVDLAACGITDPAQLANLSVTYLAELLSGGSAATALLDGVELDLTYTTPPVDRLDGVVLDVVFRPPTFRPLDGCLTAAPYDPSGGGTCALLKVTIPAVDADKTRVVAAGTIYAPSTILDIAMAGLTSQVLSRGLIARGIRIGLQPDPGFKRPTTGIPPETVVFTAYPDGNVEPATAGPSSGFADPDNAKAIGGGTSDAALTDPGAPEASLELSVYGQAPPLPGDTSIDSAVLRVAHGDDPNIGSVTVTVDFTGTTCGSGPLPALPLHGPVVEDQVDLSECGLTNTDQLNGLTGLTVTYTATVKPGMSGIDRLDGITLDVLYGPVLRTSVRFDRGQATVLGWSALR